MKIIGPMDGSLGVRGGGDDFLNFGLRDELLIASDKDPLTGDLAIIFTHRADKVFFHPDGLGGSSHHRQQVERIGDVESQNSIRLEVLKVDFEAFLGKEMQGDGITSEGIDREDVEILRLFLLKELLQNNAGISQADL